MPFDVPPLTVDLLVGFIAGWGLATVFWLLFYAPVSLTTHKRR